MVAADERRWRVGELAAATGLTVRALHHYDRLGLLVPAGRTAAGHRLYSQEEVRRLYRIHALRQLGLHLGEIASVLNHGEPGLAETVRRHLDRVERDLEHQQRLRGRLIGILGTLERSLEPSTDHFIDAMEAMTVDTDIAEIACILGTSRQIATKLAESARDFPSPDAKRTGRFVWARGQVEVWAATHPDRRPAWRRPPTSVDGRPVADVFMILELAGKLALELDHGWIGDEHLLLALLQPDCPGAAGGTLKSFGLTAQAVRRAIIESVGDWCPNAENGAFLALSTQCVLERANLKAVELRDERVSSEHALLALLEGSADSRALVLLARHGIKPARVAQHVIAITDRGAEPAAHAPSLPGEVHAAEVARILGLSRRRVVELAAAVSGFPPSEFSESGYRVWSRSAVESWAVVHADRGPRSRGLTPSVRGRMESGIDKILAIATAEAQDLNQRSVLPDHLFLALFHPDCPGEAEAVLESIGLAVEGVRASYVESMGGLFEPNDREPVVPPAVHQALELALLWAFDLVDEEVTGTHVLLALTHHRPLRAAAWDVRAATLHERLMAETGGMMPVPKPVPPTPYPWESSKRIPRPPEPELAPSPAGHAPRRRRPWRSRVAEIPGSAHEQHFVDRDGFAILTIDGRPVAALKDDAGKAVLDEEGDGILIEVPEVPEP